MNGNVLVSFERRHRIWRYPVDATSLLTPAKFGKLPAAIDDLPRNSGIEGITVMRGGHYQRSLLAFAESLRDDNGNSTGWIWVDDEPQVFHMSNPGDFDVTDAAALPDGGLLVLERRFRIEEGVKTRLRRIAPAELHPGAVIDAEVLLDAAMNQEIDNMEGLAVHTGEHGETVVTMISDDNFNKGVQRTLLLQFALDGPDRASTAAHP